MLRWLNTSLVLRHISSNPEFILNYFDHLPSNDSDSDFDDYIDDSGREDEESTPTPSNFTTHTSIYT